MPGEECGDAGVSWMCEVRLQVGESGTLKAAFMIDDVEEIGNERNGK